MSPSGSAARSGDPRRRNAAPEPSSGSGRRARIVAVALGVGGAAALALVLAVTGPEDDGSGDTQARHHAEAACVLATQAGEAAAAGEARRVDARARYAAAVLLLDRAIIESARAVRSDSGHTGLEAALQSVHTAGHAGDADGWESGLDEALTACRSLEAR